MKTKQQLREHLHTYAQIGVADGLLMGAIDLWGEDLQAKESALLEQVLSEEMAAYEAFEQLSTMAEEVSDNATPAPDKTSKSAQAQPSARPSTLSGVNLAKLQSQNSEFIAWLQIPGTSVNYPVVQTSDTVFYLTHNFKRQKAKAGTLFSLPSTDYRTQENRGLSGSRYFCRNMPRRNGRTGKSSGTPWRKSRLPRTADLPVSSLWPCPLS